MTYSFPVWASLLGWLVLGERLDRNAIIGLVLCIAGLGVLVYPVLGSDALIGLSLSLACAMTWAVGDDLSEADAAPERPARHHHLAGDLRGGRDGDSVS